MKFAKSWPGSSLFFVFLMKYASGFSLFRIKAAADRSLFFFLAAQRRCRQKDCAQEDGRHDRAGIAPVSRICGAVRPAVLRKMKRLVGIIEVSVTADLHAPAGLGIDFKEVLKEDKVPVLERRSIEADLQLRPSVRLIRHKSLFTRNDIAADPQGASCLFVHQGAFEDVFPARRQICKANGILHLHVLPGAQSPVPVCGILRPCPDRREYYALSLVRQVFVHDHGDIAELYLLGIAFGLDILKVRLLIDIVINVGMLKAGHDDYVREEIRLLKEVAGSRVLKVIIETCLLTDDEKVRACKASKKAGADFVKTSTGFSTGGATVHDVALMRKTVGPEMGVKASGGVRTHEDLIAMVEAGANRIGTSNGTKIL